MNIGVLKDKNLSKLIFCQFISQLGTGMQNFALPLYVLSLTGSGMQFSRIIAVAIIPNFLLGPFMGVIVDWFDRKKILIFLNFLSAIVTLVLFFISTNSSLKIVHIYIGVISLTIISCLYVPAESSIIPTIVTKDKLSQANSANTFFLNIANILAPIIGGFLYGILGLSIILLINSISFVITALLQLNLKVPHNGVPIEKKELFQKFISDFKVGIKYLYINKNFFKMVILIFFINMFINPIISIGFPYIFKMDFKAADFQYGIASGFLIAGIVSGALFSSYISKKMTVYTMFHKMLTLFGIVFLGMAAINIGFFTNVINRPVSIVAMSLLMFAEGMISVVFNIVFITYVQGTVPNMIYGKVFSIIITISIGAKPIGALVYGVLFDKFHSYIPVLITACTFLTLGTCYKLFLKKEDSEAYPSSISDCLVKDS